MTDKKVETTEKDKTTTVKKEINGNDIQHLIFIIMLGVCTVFIVGYILVELGIQLITLMNYTHSHGSKLY